EQVAHAEAQVELFRQAYGGRDVQQVARHLVDVRVGIEADDEDAWADDVVQRVDLQAALLVLVVDAAVHDIGALALQRSLVALAQVLQTELHAAVNERR